MKIVVLRKILINVLTLMKNLLHLNLISLLIINVLIILY